MKNKIKQSGAALLLALLITSLFSLASFAVGSVLVSEISLTGSFRNKEEAFWAAEAGIEKGLLFYRIHEETPEYPRGTTSENSKCERTVLRDSRSDRSTITPNCNNDPEGQLRVFDLRIYDKKLFTDDTEPFKLSKDQGLTLRPIGSGTLNVKWKIKDDSGQVAANPSRSRLYYRLSDQGEGEWQTSVDPNQSQVTVSTKQTAIHYNSSHDLIQIKAFLDGVAQDKIMEVSLNSRGKLIGGPYVYIESVGHYHGISKRLQVKLNRESTSIYDIMDYVIYSKNTLPTP